MAKRPTSNIVRLRSLLKVSDEVETPESVLLEDLIRGHAVLLGDTEEGQIGLIRERMRELQDTLAARVAAMEEKRGSARSIKKLNERIEQVKAIRARGLEKIADDIEKAAAAAAATESANIAKSVGALASEFEIGAGFGVLSPRQLEQVAKRDFLGATVRKWIRSRRIVGDLAIDREMRDSLLREAVDREVRGAFFTGDGIRDTASRIRSIIKNDEVDAVTVARTAISGAANEAAVETYRDNADVLDGMIWVATLDSRICEECMSLDGQKIPLKSSVAPPAHPNCRCYLAPSVKGLPQPDVPTAREWFGRQSQETQSRVLGKGRASLINRSGSQVGLSDVFRKDGGFRNLGDLERLSARRKGAAARERRGKKAA